MSYPINYPTPQGANVQVFYSNATNNVTSRHKQTWIKPQGASFVYFSLIGPGGDGGDATSDGTATANGGGGGSGGVAHCLVPAFFIPDQLQVQVGGTVTEIYYQQKDGAGYALFGVSGGTNGDAATAAAGVPQDALGGTGGGALTSFVVTALGFYDAAFGQSGANGGAASTLPTGTFLIGGVGGGGTSLTTGHYGYTVGTNGQGYGVITPIINSIANRDANGVGSATDYSKYAGFGCGGNGATASTNTTRYGLQGGPGLAVIISW